MDNLEEASALRELGWILASLDETIVAVRLGLEECLSLLDPGGPISILPLSSPRSESLKGIVSRMGSHITRADMQIKMFGLPYTRGLNAYKLTLAPTAPNNYLVLDQLVDVKNCIISSLDLLHPVLTRKHSVGPLEGKSIIKKLYALQDNVLAARAALKEPALQRLFPYHVVDSKAFDPPLPKSIVLNWYVSDAALVAEIRTLDRQFMLEAQKVGFSVPTLDISSSFGFRERFAAAVGFRGDGYSTGDTGEENTIQYQGVVVKVRESVKVESQDPSLMAIWAKLSGLEHIIGSSTKALELVLNAVGV